MRIFNLLFLLLINSNIFLFASSEDYLFPKSTIVDFTFNNQNIGSEPVEEYNSYIVVDKVNFELQKIFSFIPRYNEVAECVKSEYNDTYGCPIDEVQGCSCEGTVLQNGLCEVNGIITPPKGYDGRECILKNGVYVTSPFECNQNNKCGYGFCAEGQETSTADHIQPYTFHPIHSKYRTQEECTSLPCAEQYEYSNGIATEEEGKEFSCDTNTYVGQTDAEGNVLTCESYDMNTANSSVVFTCNPGNLNGDQCCTTSTEAASVSDYYCPSGGSLSSTNEIECRDECTWWTLDTGYGGKAYHQISGGSACGSSYFDYWSSSSTGKCYGSDCEQYVPSSQLTYQGSCGTNVWTTLDSSTRPKCTQTTTTTNTCSDRCNWWTNADGYGGISAHYIGGVAECGQTYYEYWSDAGTGSCTSLTSCKSKAGITNLDNQGACADSRTWEITDTTTTRYNATAVYQCEDSSMSLQGSQCTKTECYPAEEDIQCDAGSDNNLGCEGNFPDTWLLSLYTYHLCRCPDQAEYDYWLQRTNMEGRDTIYTYFHENATFMGESFSVDGCGELEKTDNIVCEGNFPNQGLYDFYVNHLCRCPDQEGYNFWQELLISGYDHFEVYESIKIAAAENGTPYKEYCGTLENKCFSGQITESAPSVETYTYYTYECPLDANEQGLFWELLVSNEDPGCVDDTYGNCINFTKETGVCRRLKLTCPVEGGVCQANPDGEYVCSDSNCIQQDPCIGEICDYAIYDKVGYCQNLVCPQIDGLIEENGRCFIKACPDGSLDFDGECRMDE